MWYLRPTSLQTNDKRKIRCFGCETFNQIGTTCRRIYFFPAYTQLPWIWCLENEKRLIKLIPYCTASKLFNLRCEKSITDLQPTFFSTLIDRSRELPFRLVSLVIKIPKLPNHILRAAVSCILLECVFLRVQNVNDKFHREAVTTGATAHRGNSFRNVSIDVGYPEQCRSTLKKKCVAGQLRGYIE